MKFPKLSTIKEYLKFKSFTRLKWIIWSMNILIGVVYLYAYFTGNKSLADSLAELLDLFVKIFLTTAAAGIVIFKTIL